MNPVNEFIQIVDDIYGLYLDCTAGINKWRDWIMQMGKKSTDSNSFSYGKGIPPNGKRLHKVTFGEIKERTEKNGKDHQRIGRLCLVMIYQYWEDCYREKIAKYCNVEKCKVQSDIMGDLRLLRISVIHNQSKAKETDKMKIIKWFKENEEININNQQFEIVIDEIKKDLAGRGKD